MPKRPTSARQGSATRRLQRADDIDASLPRFTVGSVAQRLHVPIATLRSWNHRYGIGPSAHRAGRHRLYSETDIATMQLMRDLIEDGANPGAAARSAMAAVFPGRTDPDALLAAAFELDTDRVARLLDAMLRSAGVLDTWNEVIRPAFRTIQTRQAAGSACIDVEHALSWTVIRSLQRISVATPASTASILLACTSAEWHTLPLEALRAGLAERGSGAVMLGADVPLVAVAEALEKRPPPATVVLWAHTERTADAELTRQVAAQARVILGGPGWPASQAGRKGRRVTSLHAAIERVAQTGVG